MLNTNPDNLIDEIEAAEQLRDHVINSSEEMVREYVGKFYRDDQDLDHEVPRPFIFEWLSQVTPTVIFDNPRVEVSARASGASTDDLKRLKHGINRTVEDIDAWWILMLVWFDTAFSFGVTRTTMEALPGFPGDRWGRKPQRPTMHRVAPHHYIHDTQSGGNPRKARLQGHMWAADRDALLKDPRFDDEALKRIGKDAAIDKYDPASSGQERVSREQVVAYDLWIPEEQHPRYKKKDGYYGTIHTIAAAYDREGKRQSSHLIREPRPFYGPDTGPYELFGIYNVPDQVFPLSPLAATRQQMKTYNAHAASAERRAKREKQFIGVDPSNPDTAKRLKEVPDGGVEIIPGLRDGAAQEMGISGPSEKDYNWMNLTGSQWERSSGINDAALGQVSGEGTATEQAQAQAARDDRIGYMASMYQNSVQRNLYRIGWYTWNSQHVDMELGPEAAEDLYPRPMSIPPESDAERIAMRTNLGTDRIRRALHWSPKLWLRRGNPRGFPQADSFFDHAMIKIEPLSMERTSEPLMQKRRLEWMQLVTQVAPLIRQYPEVDWIALLDQVGQAFNQTDAGELINEQLAYQLGGYGQVMQAAGADEGMGQGGGGMSMENLMGQVQQGQSQQNDQRTGNATGAQQAAAMNAS